MSKHRKIPYALDSYIIINEKTKKRTIVYGERDKAYLSTEIIVEKKHKRDRRKGNKQGKRYYVEWCVQKHYDDSGIKNKSRTSNYFLGFKQATECAYRQLEKNPYMDVYIYEETNIDDEWVVTNKEFMFL